MYSVIFEIFKGIFYTYTFSYISQKFKNEMIGLDFSFIEFVKFQSY